MKRVIEAFHVGKSSERRIGLIQIILVVAVIGGTMGLTRLIRHSASTAPDISATLANIVVDVVEPVVLSHRIERKLTGEVEARANVAITPQISGRVVRINPGLMPGAFIKAGDILFEIEPADYALAVQQAEAQVASAEAELLQTRATAGNFIKDWQRVFPDQPAPALVAKEPQVQALEARLKSAKAAVSQARLNLARTQYKLDYDARIVESQIERGQYVSALGKYGSFYALDGLRVRTSITSEDRSRLGLIAGSELAITDGSTGATVTAAITSIGASLADRTRLLPLFVQLPASADMVPGTFVTVIAQASKREEAFRLPVSALATSSSVWTVAGGKLKQVDVEIIDQVDGAIFVRRFDAGQGVVTTEVPTSFINRPVQIRKTMRAGEAS